MQVSQPVSLVSSVIRTDPRVNVLPPCLLPPSKARYTCSVLTSSLFPLSLVSRDTSPGSSYKIHKTELTAPARPSPTFFPLCFYQGTHSIVAHTDFFPIQEPHLFPTCCGIICHCLQRSVHVRVQFTSSKTLLPS